MLSYLRRLAQRQEARRTAPPVKLHPVSQYLHATRSDGLPDIPELTSFDLTVEGNILLDADLFTDEGHSFDSAELLNLPVERTKNGNFFRLQRVSLHGIQFRLFDPRGLYPGEDRMGFVFIESDEAPFFNGRLVLVNDHSFCQVYNSELVQQADFYLAQPYVHLRYYLEGWIDLFFTWLKHYWLPTLAWVHGFEANRNYETYIAALAPLLEKSPHDAMDMIFEKLLSDFEEEADRWIKDMGDLPN